MKMIKPSINKIGVFDASKDYTIEFEYQGNQPYLNEIYIFDADTNAQVYHNSIETMKLMQTIPSGSLSNNKQYYIQVCVYDVNGEVSELSDSLYFWCYSTPQLSLTTLNSDGSTLINTSNYEVGVSYSQAENRKISEYVYYLYDSTKTQIYASGTKYYSTDMGNILSCPLKALESGNIYYFSIRVITVDNITVEIPKVKFSVDYRKPLSYSVLNVECDKKAGYMKYSTYIVMVEGHATGNYKLNDGLLEIENGKVYYNTGFSISDDFVIGIKYKNGTSICLSNKSDTITLTQEEYEGKIHYKLEVTNDILPSMIQYSDFFDDINKLRTIYIKRINGIY